MGGRTRGAPPPPLPSCPPARPPQLPNKRLYMEKVLQAQGSAVQANQGENAARTAKSG